MNKKVNLLIVSTLYLSTNSIVGMQLQQLPQQKRQRHIVAKKKQQQKKTNKQPVNQTITIEKEQIKKEGPERIIMKEESSAYNPTLPVTPNFVQGGKIKDAGDLNLTER